MHAVAVEHDDLKMVPATVHGTHRSDIVDGALPVVATPAGGISPEPPLDRFDAEATVDNPSEAEIVQVGAATEASVFLLLRADQRANLAAGQTA